MFFMRVVVLVLLPLVLACSSGRATHDAAEEEGEPEDAATEADGRLGKRSGDRIGRSPRFLRDYAGDAPRGVSRH